MVFVYKSISKFIKSILNLIFFIQIGLLILIFLTAAYWFFELIGSSLFNFAAPLANAIAGFVKTLYTHDIMLDGVYIDGSLLLFDVVTAIVVILLAKSKYYLYKLVENLDYAVILTNRKNEKKLNKELEKEAEEIIRKYRKAAIVVEFTVRNIEIDNVWGTNPEAGVKEKTEEALKIFYASMKSVAGCNFAKTDNRLAILIDDFEKFDNVVLYMQQAIKRIKENMKKFGWELITYSVAEAYYDSADFKNEVYPSMEKLLKLKHKNELMCYGNFNLRYNLMHEPMYYLILAKGDYQMKGSNDTVNIYTIVKKS